MKVFRICVWICVSNICLNNNSWTYYIQFLLKELFWRLKKIYLKLVSLISQAKSVKFSKREINFCLSVDLYKRICVRVRVWSNVTTRDIPKISLNSAILRFWIINIMDIRQYCDSWKFAFTRKSVCSKNNLFWK